MSKIGTQSSGLLPTSKLAVGAPGELITATHFALLGHQVYRPLVDDRGVDLLVDVGRGRHLMIQVKTIVPPKGNYVFMRKSGFPLVPWVALALVVFDHNLDDRPEKYLIPAQAWIGGLTPLTQNDYGNGLKSAPEYGIRLRKDWRTGLLPWAATTSHIKEILDEAAQIEGL